MDALYTRMGVGEMGGLNSPDFTLPSPLEVYVIARVPWQNYIPLTYRLGLDISYVAVKPQSSICVCITSGKKLYSNKLIQNTYIAVILCYHST